MHLAQMQECINRKYKASLLPQGFDILLSLTFSQKNNFFLHLTTILTTNRVQNLPEIYNSPSDKQHFLLPAKF